MANPFDALFDDPKQAAPPARKAPPPPPIAPPSPLDARVGKLGEVAGYTANAALAPVRAVGAGAGNIGQALLNRQQKKRVGELSRLTGSAIQEASNVFGPFQDFLGATAKDVQTKGLGRFVGDTLYHNFVDPLVHPGDPVTGKSDGSATGDLTERLGNARSLRDLQAINTRYQLFSPAMLDDLRQGKPGAIASLAGFARANPHMTGLASLVTEFMNPIGVGIGRTAEGVAGTARAAGDAVSDSAARTAAGAVARGKRADVAVSEDAARKAAKAAPPPVAYGPNRPVPVAPPPVTRAERIQRAQDAAANTKGAVESSIGGTRDKIANTFSRYHDLTKHGAVPGMLRWALKREASGGSDTAKMAVTRDAAYGPDLTRDQQIEVLSRAEGSPKYEAVRIDSKDPARIVPEPKGSSLDERAAILQAHAQELDKYLETTDADLLPKKRDEFIMSYAPSKKFPMFKHEQPEVSPANPGYAFGSSGGMSAPTGARGGLPRKYNTLLEYLQNGAELDPSFLPATQFMKSAVSRAKSATDTLRHRELEKIPVDVGGGVSVNARGEYEYYKIQPDGTRLEFGVGEDGRKKRDAFVTRGATGQARAEVLAQHNLRSMPRVAQSSRYLRGVLDRAGTDATKTERFSDALVDQGTRYAKRVQPATAAQAFKDALAPQSKRVENLGQTIADNAATRERLKGSISSGRADVAELRDAHASARKLAGNLHRSEYGAEFDNIANKIAENRIDKPAGTNLSTYERSDGTTQVLGNASSFNGTQYTKAEVSQVVAAMNRARKAKPPDVAGGAARAKATSEDAVGILDVKANAIAQARERVDNVVSTYDLNPKFEGTTMPMSMQNKAARIKSMQEGFQAALGDDQTLLKKTGAVPGAVKKAAGAVARGQASTESRVSRVAQKADDDAAKVAAKAIEGPIAQTATVVRATQRTANDLSDLFLRWQQAKGKEDLLKQIRDEVAAKIHGFENIISKGTEHLPTGASEPNFVRESDLRLNIPGSESKYIHKDAYNFLDQAAKAGAPPDQSVPFLNFIGALGNLTRVGIILLPTIHIIWNLGRAFLAEGGDIRRMNSSLGEMSAATASKVGVPIGTKWEQFSEDTGTASTFNQESFGLARNTSNDALATQNISELPLLGKAERVLARGIPIPGTGGRLRIPGWNDNQWLVFHVFEKRYAAELLRKFIEQDGMEVGPAVRRVRQALGDFGNVTLTEQRWKNLFLFYPWMKTVIPFWAKQGLFHPNQWNAPMTAVRQNNENMNDPEADYKFNPWQYTLWQNADKSFERIAFSDPARSLAPVADLARIPIDFFRGITSRGMGGRPQDEQGFGVIPSDTSRMVQYMRGHIKPALAPFVNAVFPAGKYERLADPKAPWQEQRDEAADRLFGSFVAPYEGIKNFVRNPLSATIGTALGGSTSSSGGDTDPIMALREKQIRNKYGRDRARAQQAGNENALARINMSEQADLAALHNGTGGGRALGAPPVSPTLAPLPASSPASVAPRAANAADFDALFR